MSDLTDNGLIFDSLNQVAPIVLLHIFTLKNLRRYPPQSGPMPRFKETVRDVPNRFYTDLNGRVTPFPVSLFVQVRRLGFLVVLVDLPQRTSLMSEASEDLSN